MRFLLSIGSMIRSGAVVSFLLMSTAAHAGIFDDDEARKAILELRQQITSMNATINNNLNAIQQRNDDVQQRNAEAQQKNTDVQKRSNEDIALLRKSIFELQNQIDSQKNAISQLRGENEVLARNLADTQIRQKDMLQSAEQKLQAVEQRSQAAEQRSQAVEQRSQAVEQKLTQLEPVTVSLDGREFMADPAEKRDFDAAFALFRIGDFAKSQKAFFDFIQRYPVSGYSPSALFWLGNAQYSNRDYKEAIINFRSMISKNPDHIRAPEAMLSIANCQIEMKDTKSARKTIEDLMKLYSKSEAAVVGAERLRTLK